MSGANSDDKVIASAEGIVDGEKPPLVEAGVYDFGFLFHRTSYLFGRAPKLSCHFRIVSEGSSFGTVLCRHYNVKTLHSKPRKGGSFKVSWRCDFMREYATLFGLPARQDRVSTEIFRTQIIRGRVATVSTDSKGRAIPPGLQYSVIAELLEVRK